MSRNLREQYQRPRAIIYTPRPDDIEALDRCHRHVATRQYRLVGIVTEYRAAQAMIEDGRAQIMIVDRWRDLPEDRAPRVEVVELAPPADYAGRPSRFRARRTQRLNRAAGA